jgi:hypothetical protein
VATWLAAADGRRVPAARVRTHRAATGERSRAQRLPASPARTSLTIHRDGT